MEAKNLNVNAMKGMMVNDVKWRYVPLIVKIMGYAYRKSTNSVKRSGNVNVNFHLKVKQKYTNLPRLFMFSAPVYKSLEYII